MIGSKKCFQAFVCASFLVAAVSFDTEVLADGAPVLMTQVEAQTAFNSLGQGEAPDLSRVLGLYYSDCWEVEYQKASWRQNSAPFTVLESDPGNTESIRVFADDSETDETYWNWDSKTIQAYFSGLDQPGTAFFSQSFATSIAQQYGGVTYNLAASQEHISQYHYYTGLTLVGNQLFGVEVPTTEESYPIPLGQHLNFCKLHLVGAFAP